MVNEEHRKQVYDELMRKVKASSAGNLVMDAFTARQLFCDDNDPNFIMDPGTTKATFCGVPITWSNTRKIILYSRLGGLLYSIEWDPDPYKKTASQAMRFNEGKLEWSLIDFSQLEGMVRVLMFGRQKYDRDNWKKGLPMRQQCDSMMGHLTAIMKGQVKDEETGLYHWDHIMCNAMFMSHTYQNHPQHISLPCPPNKLAPDPMAGGMIKPNKSSLIDGKQPLSDPQGS